MKGPLLSSPAPARRAWPMPVNLKGTCPCRTYGHRLPRRRMSRRRRLAIKYTWMSRVATNAPGSCGRLQVAFKKSPGSTRLSGLVRETVLSDHKAVVGPSPGLFIRPFHTRICTTERESLCTSVPARAPTRQQLLAMCHGSKEYTYVVDVPANRARVAGSWSRS